MTKGKLYYRPGEVSEMLGIPVTTLRYWEAEFSQLSPMRTESGHRRYSPEDIETCRTIIGLLRDKGLSIEYSKRELDKMRKYPPKRFVCSTAGKARRLLSEARERTEDVQITARIGAVEKWLAKFEAAKIWKKRENKEKK